MAETQSQWPAFAREILPMGWELAENWPFAMSVDGLDVTWVCQTSEVHGELLRESLVSGDGKWRLGVKCRRHPETRALVVEAVLENGTERPSGPITRLEPLRLAWRHEGEQVHARLIGGGFGERVYPPHAYRVDTLRLDAGGAMSAGSCEEGWSSGRHLPVLSVAAGDSAVAAGMEWSGVWTGGIESVASNEVRLRLEAHAKGIVLGPGESLAWPMAHYVFASGGMEGATNALRNYLSREFLPKVAGGEMGPAVVVRQEISAEDRDSGECEARVIREAELAARAGAECFVLGLGWNQGGVAGTWGKADPGAFPRGLRLVSEKVRHRGVGFGLTFELEWAHRDSEWVTGHPDWFVDVGGDYLQMDFGDRFAQQACIDLLTRWARELSLKWIRLECRRGPGAGWERLDVTGKRTFAWVAGFYGVLDELRRQCPATVVELSGAGGRRIDLGTLRRAHVHWLSEDMAPSDHVRYMQVGAGYCLPGRAAAVGMALGAGAFLDRDVACRMLGTMAVVGRLGGLEEGELGRLGRMVEVFRTYRHLLCGDFYPLLAQPRGDEDWEAVEYCDAQGHEAVVFLFTGSQELAEPRPVLRLKGLRSNARYVVRRLGGATRSTMTGEELMQEGLKAQLGANAFAAWHVEVGGTLDRERLAEAGARAAYGVTRLGSN